MQFIELSQYGNPAYYRIPAVQHSREEETIETVKSSEGTRSSGQGWECGAGGQQNASDQYCNGEDT